jgi:arabinofuranan 3-O-arabinosyltransferase
VSNRGRLAARLRSAATDAGAPRTGPTWASAAVVVAVLLLNLLQQPGRITFDTKLDLQFAPLDFLTRSLSLWNPDAAVGGLQNQASGYLFPMGPVFAVGELVHASAWVWERLWSALSWWPPTRAPGGSPSPGPG